MFYTALQFFPETKIVRNFFARNILRRREHAILEAYYISAATSNEIEPAIW